MITWEPFSRPSMGASISEAFLRTYDLILGSRTLPASMYLLVLSPGYSPAISQAILKGVMRSLIPRMGPSLVPEIFFFR